jgi:hypothetical protein
VRAAIARLDMRDSLLRVCTLVNPRDLTREERVYWRCVTDSIWEGRLVTTRWLIEFIGICQWKGKPARPRRKESGPDISIAAFDGGDGNLFDLTHSDAIKLADFWGGCSQASSHPTHNSQHSPTNEAHLVPVLVIVVKHLQNTIYQHGGENLRDYVLARISHSPNNQRPLANA